MTQPPIDPARVPDATARQLLARAAELDADGPTLAQLRQAASEAGISGGAFDAAVVEWRTKHTLAAPQTTRRAWLDAIGRNAVACAGSWISLSAFAAVQRLIQAPWLLHKLSDPVGLAIGAAIAVRLRARTAAVILGGLAVSQGAEFLMDVSGGAPAVQGAGPHFALMIAGVTGVAVAHWFVQRSRGTTEPQSGGPGLVTSSEPSTSEPVGLTNAEADKRPMDMLRLRRSFYWLRLQLS